MVSIVAWLALTPVLNSIGAAATLLDAFCPGPDPSGRASVDSSWVRRGVGGLGSLNVVAGTYHYAQQQLYFTRLLYFVLLLLAVWGWWRWVTNPLPVRPRLKSGRYRGCRADVVTNSRSRWVVSLIGGECSNESTLAKAALAARLDGILVVEQLRLFVDEHGRPPLQENRLRS